jgi:hypothetical protein
VLSAGRLRFLFLSHCSLTFYIPGTFICVFLFALHDSDTYIENNYHFSPQIVGLSYLGIGTGFLIGQIVFARLGNRILKTMAKRCGNGEMKPEYRLPLCCFGGLFTPVGLFCEF